MDVDIPPLYARLFGRAPIYDGVLSCLEPRSLLRVALTCRIVYFAVADFKARAFNVNRHFSRYFSDPLAFRSLQAKTNTLVSGSDALQFLDRTFYPESDLDLYTHPGHSFEVAQFLVQVEGYQFAPREDQDQDWKQVIRDNWDGTQRRVMIGTAEGYPLEGITAVWTFKKTGRKEETLRVQIIEATSSPVEAILDFHSSTSCVVSLVGVLSVCVACVMNFITSDAAYSLYPIATFVDRRTLGMPSARHSSRAIQKYVKRGWRVYFMPTPDDMAHQMRAPFHMSKTRWVGDDTTWVLPLDQTGVKARPPLSPASAPLTFDHVLCHGWQLRLLRGYEGNGYACHAYKVQTTIFRYNYAIPDEALSYEIRAWAHQQGKYSHMSVAREDWVWWVAFAWQWCWRLMCARFDADLPGFLQHSKNLDKGVS